MATSTKTDNAKLRPKLTLRRHFLGRYHSDGSGRVLDCCQGGGVLWSILRREFTVASYWGVDLKPKPGRLKIDSVKILSQPGWTQNIIDIDTYGSPWTHYTSLLPHVTAPTTVFATIGLVRVMGGGSFSSADLDPLGLGPIRKLAPIGLIADLAESITMYAIHQAWDHGLRIVELAEAPRSARARYIGIRLEPI